jgi:hypothetical protein
MIRRLIAISTVISLVSMSGIAVLAQSFGNSGSRGGMSGSAFSGSGMSGGFGGMSGMSGGMGSSGFGGGMGSSGFGGMGGGMGSSGFGNSGMGSNSMFGNSSNGMGGQQNFIGRDAGDMQAAFGQMTKASTQYMNNMNRNMRSGNRKSAKKPTQSAGQPMRVEVKVAFNPPRLSSDQMARDVRTRLTKLLVANHMSQPTVIMEGDTVVLRGAAASENERDIISQLLAMEPGIRNVRNEMNVAQPAGAASGTAPTPGS